MLLVEARRIDPVGLAQYLAFGHTLPSATLFGSIRKVPPGVAMAWRPGPDGRIAPASESTEPDHVPVMPLADAVGDSVRAHLVADVDVGVFLSGGTDSTLITSYARETVAAVRTYSISFPEMPEIDESPLAASNAAALGTRHRTFPVTVDQLVGALDRFLAVNGEPAGDPAALPLTMLAADVQGDVKVVLTGEGADEMFGGYRRYDISKYLRRAFRCRECGDWLAVGRHRLPPSFGPAARTSSRGAPSRRTTRARRAPRLRSAGDRAFLP